MLFCMILCDIPMLCESSFIGPRELPCYLPHTYSPATWHRHYSSLLPSTHILSCNMTQALLIHSPERFCLVSAKEKISSKSTFRSRNIVCSIYSATWPTISGNYPMLYKSSFMTTSLPSSTAYYPVTRTLTLITVTEFCRNRAEPYATEWLLLFIGTSNFHGIPC